MQEWNPNRKVVFSDTDADAPSYPVRTLVGHIAMKGVQVGAVAGLFVGVPLISFLRKLPMSTAWRRVMFVAPIIGSATALAGLGLLDYSKPMGSEGIDDRAYRIKHNKAQNRVDNRTVVGAAVGAAVGTVVVPGFASVFAAASTGVAVAFLYDKGEAAGLWQLAAKHTEELKKQISAPRET
jgi:hypothetical protein